MGEILEVNKHLAIELLPSSAGSDPALRLFVPNDPERAFVIFLSEIYQLRDSLALAGTRLTELEQEIRRRID
jgi:hypothetical protein